MRSIALALVSVLLAVVPGGSFIDDDSSVHEGAIEAIAAEGVTRGCNPPDNDRFCPEDPVSRGQMAAFLARALSLGPVPSSFTDATGSIFAAEIGALAAAGVTRGCNPPVNNRFCPDDPVSRGQMAAFLVRAFDYPPGPNVFIDTSGSVFAADIGALAAAGITRGCNPPTNTRPDGWTSADAAGLPIFAGLVRYDEVAAGEIRHAIRFTAAATRDVHVWPARHHAGTGTHPDLPPMGQRFRLRADFDTAGFHPHARVILEAMKTYGIILADNGSAWYISGAPDPRWDNDLLHQLDVVSGSDFEAVDVSGLIVDPDSGRAG